MKRIIRDRRLTPEEVAKYNLIRQQVAQDLPELIARHQSRMKAKAMKWIKTWALIGDDGTYLVLAVGVGGERKEFFYSPQVLRGWQVKRLMEGTYVATELTLPVSFDACD